MTEKTILPECPVPCVSHNEKGLVRMHSKGVGHQKPTVLFFVLQVAATHLILKTCVQASPSTWMIMHVNEGGYIALGIIHHPYGLILCICHKQHKIGIIWHKLKLLRLPKPRHLLFRVLQ